MYNIDIYYNGSWHTNDTANTYHEAVKTLNTLKEAMGDDVLITISPDN